MFHAFFSLLARNNDFNDIFDRSSMVANLLLGGGCDITFHVNGNTYLRYYLLAYGIILYGVVLYKQSTSRKMIIGLILQKCKKGPECIWSNALGCCKLNLPSSKTSLSCRSKTWFLTSCLHALLVLHNMIVEDEQDTNLEPLYDPMAPHSYEED
jgi:hypothetical protein